MRPDPAKAGAAAARAAAAALLAAACAAPRPFSPQMPDNRVEDVRAVLARLPSGGGPRNATGRPLAFAATEGAAPEIVAWDLGRAEPIWRQPARARSRIVVGRDAIFLVEGEREVVARDVRTGDARWRAAVQGGDRLLGMAADAGALYYVTEETGRREAGRQVGLLVALDAATGAERWRLPAESRMGVPAAAGGLVFVPFAHQYLVAIDGATAREVARIRHKQEVIGFARATEGAVFYGSRGVHRLDETSVLGTREGASFVRADLPGEFVHARWWWDGYNPASNLYTAFDRNRVLWLAHGRSGDLRLSDGLVVLHSYRFFFAFRTDGTLRWAYSFPRTDVVASHLVGAHVLLVSREGDVVALDTATGAPVWQAAIGAPVRGVTFDAGLFRPPGKVTLVPDLRETLTGIIWDPDRRFEAIKLFCVDQLARLRDPAVAEDLLQILTFEKIERRVYERAGKALVDRADPSMLPLLLRGLAVRTDYAEGARARAVGVLAQAASKLRAQEAVQPLLLHFLDHETSLQAMREIAGALLEIGSRTAIEPFRTFLLTYRAEDELADEPEVARRVVEGLLRLGDHRERQLLRFVAEDPQTVPFLRAYVRETLGLPADKAADKGEQGREGAARAEKARAAGAPAADAKPADAAAGAKPADAKQDKPADAKPAQARPAEDKPAEPKPESAKPAEPKGAAPAPDKPQAEGDQQPAAP